MAGDAEGVLGELGEKYSDELYSLFPFQRILFLFISVPMVLAGLSEQTMGIALELSRQTPMQTLRYDDGAIWRQSWSSWLMLLFCYFTSVFAAALIQRFTNDVMTKSKHLKKYLIRIRKSADSIAQELDDTTSLVAALLARFNARKKALIIRFRVSETVTATWILWFLLISKWDRLDIYIFCLFTALTFLTQIATFRFYIANVAPTWLLIGFLTKSHVQIEDGFTPISQ